MAKDKMALHATRALLGPALFLAVLLAHAGGATADDLAAAPSLASAPVATDNVGQRMSYDGVVQAVRQTVIAAQVPGAVVALDVRAGDKVRAGQVLLRLDARAAEQTAAAGAAQVLAARAAQDAATKEFERQRQLFEKHYISQAALDRAEAQYKASQAESAAQLANAGAARTQSGFYVVKAPYDGVVSDVSVVLGDMAMPGRALLTVYDPKALRVSAAIPETVFAQARPGDALQVELPGAAGRIVPVRVQWLPAADPVTHTLELRLDLPSGQSRRLSGHVRARLAARCRQRERRTACMCPPAPSCAAPN